MKVLAFWVLFWFSFVFETGSDCSPGWPKLKVSLTQLLHAGIQVHTISVSNTHQCRRVSLVNSTQGACCVLQWDSNCLGSNSKHHGATVYWIPWTPPAWFLAILLIIIIIIIIIITIILQKREGGRREREKKRDRSIKFIYIWFQHVFQTSTLNVT